MAEKVKAQALAQGPQEYKDAPPDEPVAQPPDIESPTEEERREELASPAAGYPTEDVNPRGGETPSPAHPETLGDTSRDQQSS